MSQIAHPIDRHCQTCGAVPGDKCRRRVEHENKPWPGQEMSFFHAGRFAHSHLAKSQAGAIHVRDPGYYLAAICGAVVKPGNVSSKAYISCRNCRTMEAHNQRLAQREESKG